MADERECGKEALVLVFWPGKDPLPMCPDHHAWMVKVAGAIGLYVATQEAGSGATCKSKVKDEQPTS